MISHSNIQQFLPPKSNFLTNESYSEIQINPKFVFLKITCSAFEAKNSTSWLLQSLNLGFRHINVLYLEEAQPSLFMGLT